MNTNFKTISIELIFRFLIVTCFFIFQSVLWSQEKEDDADCGCGQALPTILKGSPFHAILAQENQSLELFITQDRYHYWSDDNNVYKSFDKKKYLNRRTSACSKLQRNYRKAWKAHVKKAVGTFVLDEEKTRAFGQLLNRLVNKEKINYQQLNQCFEIQYRIE